MHAKIAFGALAALGVAAGIVIYTRPAGHAELPPPPQGSASAPHLENAGARGIGSGSALEKPWLSREATEQIVGADGALGPLFTGVVLGGPAPADAVRARIAAFAKANDVAIDFELAGEKLVAVRFTVTFGGCCGYEGADKLGLRFQRPRYYGGDGNRGTWANDWAYDLPDGTRCRVDLRVARVSARWERMLSITEMLARADALIGADPETVRAAAGDHWRTIVDGQSFLLEVPYPFIPSGYGSISAEHYDLGFVVGIERGKIHEVQLGYSDGDTDELALDKAARARWGAPRAGDNGPTWRTSKRSVARDYHTLTIRGVP